MSGSLISGFMGAVRIESALDKRTSGERLLTQNAVLRDGAIQNSKHRNSARDADKFGHLRDVHEL